MWWLLSLLSRCPAPEIKHLSPSRTHSSPQDPLSPTDRRDPPATGLIGMGRMETSCPTRLGRKEAVRPTVWPNERADRAGLGGGVQGLSLRGQGRMPHSESGPLLRVRTSWSDISSARLPHYFHSFKIVVRQMRLGGLVMCQRYSHEQISTSYVRSSEPRGKIKGGQRSRMRVMVYPV